MSMSRKSRWVAGIVAAVVVAAGGTAYAFWQGFGGDEPAPVALSGPSSSSSPGSAGDPLDGTWTIDATTGSLAATFTLTRPIEVGRRPKDGETVEVNAVGDLTLHGVTKRVSVPIQAAIVGDRIEAIASFDVALAGYDIQRPTGFLILSIADT